MLAYFDASAFVKLAISEVGTDEAREAWSAAGRRASSQLLYVEARAAVARAVRMARLDAEAGTEAREAIEGLWDAAERVEVTASLVRRAGDLAEAHGLRGYDAVHLAAFEEVADDDAVLVAADGELLRAATAHGFATVTLPR